MEKLIPSRSVVRAFREVYAKIVLIMIYVVYDLIYTYNILNFFFIILRIAVSLFLCHMIT